MSALKFINCYRAFIVLASVVFISACETVPEEPYDFSAFNTTAPKSILIVPIVNESVEVDAGNFMLTTMPKPVSEAGYYVFPVNTVKYLLEQEGFYEPEQVQSQAPESLAELFGADAILYATIKRWDARYIVLSTTITVAVDYKLVGRDGTELWSESSEAEFTPQSDSNTGLLGMLVTAAVARAKPNYIPVAQRANKQALLTGKRAIPVGPYAPAE